MYLWHAHNLVNARLKGHETEDPEYPKFQFPPAFLCPTCRSTNSNITTNNKEFNDKNLPEYLIKYYSKIKPITL